MSNIIDEIDKASMRDDIPEFRPGDSVKVHVKVVEGSRTRVQVFAGTVISRTGGGVQESFTVRKLSFGTGVERTFPLHSPIIEKIEVDRHGAVRRAKLYYLRGLRGKAAKIKEKGAARGRRPHSNGVSLARGPVFVCLMRSGSIDARRGDQSVFWTLVTLQVGTCRDVPGGKRERYRRGV